MLIEQIISEKDPKMTYKGPSVPTDQQVTPANVAKIATQKGAMDLSKTNLLGTFGTKDAPRALIMMPDGTRKKVTVGDTVNGMTITNIGDGNVQFTSGGNEYSFDGVGSSAVGFDPVVSTGTGEVGMDADGNIVQYGNGMTTSLRPKARPTDYEPVDPDAVDQAIRKALEPEQPKNYPDLKPGDYRRQPYHPFRQKGD